MGNPGKQIANGGMNGFGEKNIIPAGFMEMSAQLRIDQSLDQSHGTAQNPKHKN